MARTHRFTAPLTGLLLVLVSSQVQAGVASATSPARAPAEISVSGTSANGHLRCTATFPESLTPGSDTGMQVYVKNRTAHKIHFGEGPSGTLEVLKNGSKLWETGLDYFPGPPPPPLDVQAHRTKRLSVDDVAIRWGGTLTLDPICSGLRIDLPSVTLPVHVPGPTPTTGAALSSAIAQSRGVFDGCTPTANNAGVNGTFPPPADSKHLPALDMHCWADVQRKAGFAVVDLHLVTPHDAPRVSLPIEDVPGGNLPRTSMQAVTWEYLVSQSGIAGVGTEFLADVPVNRQARSFEMEYFKGKWSATAEPCGDRELGWSPVVSIWLVWMNRCVGTSRSAPSMIPTTNRRSVAEGATVRTVDGVEVRSRPLR